jgi:hypothetical protein
MDFTESWQVWHNHLRSHLHCRRHTQVGCERLVRHLRVVHHAVLAKRLSCLPEEEDWYG